MDLWVVAAAAAAGYLRKYCQNHSRDNSSSGDSNFKKSESPGFASGKLAQREKQGFDGYTNRRTHSDYNEVIKVASTSGFACENYDDSNLLSLSTFPSGFSTNEIANEVVHGGNVGENCVGEIDYFHGFRRKKTSLRTKHTDGRFVKPLSSLESCLMAQLYNERVRLEDYILSSLPSPSTPNTRPLLVTDGKRIISRANTDSFGRQTETRRNQLRKDSYLERSEIVSGVSLSPKLGSSIKLVNGKQFQSRDGSQNEAVLFCIGITIGLISSFVANKREVDKLKQSLKQTENLVQDLHEELEMKNSLTVKELDTENYKTHDTADSSFQVTIPDSFATEKNMAASTNEKPESSDCMSKIEAELEAELERLGLNMHTSTLNSRLTEIEIDQCFVEDYAHGELRTDMFKGEAALLHESNQNSSSTSTTHYGNYAVSPRELSLKLHEVINSRLEERVMELETALQNSEKKVKLVESECKYQGQTFSEREQNCVEPLVMNLSGEALDAYNEAYEELLKVNDSDEEYSPVHPHPFSRTLSYGHSDGANDSLEHLIPDEEKTTPEEIFSSHLRLEDDNSTRVQELLDFVVSEEDESDDEMEKELIKQIVERAKKGSPAMLNAQKGLFFMDGK